MSLAAGEIDPESRLLWAGGKEAAATKTVLTEVGEVEIEVPRDRDGSFEPKIVKKRQCRLTGVDEPVISLAAGAKDYQHLSASGR